MAVKLYQCKYCGLKRSVGGMNIPLKTPCKKRKPKGTHVWVCLGKLGG